MTTKIYLAIIFSDYQELNLKRFIDHFHIKDEIIVINARLSGNYPAGTNAEHSNLKKKTIKFPKNVKIKNFSDKYTFSIYFLLALLKNFSCKIKFIFGNPASKFCTFLRKFIDGKNQFYVDDGLQTICYDFNQLKKDCTIFTVYNIKLPSKIKKIQYFPKYTKKRKKTCNEIFFIGSPLVSNNILSRDAFIKIMKILSKKNKKFYYYPHKFEITELSLLPENFEIIKRTSSVERYIYNYKYNFKLIYSFGSSCFIEIINFYKKENIKIFDINQWIENSSKNLQQKKKFKISNNYLRKLKINNVQLKKNNT